MSPWIQGGLALGTTLLAIPLGMAWLGSRLPREHTASVTLDLPAPPDAVYAFMRERAGKDPTYVIDEELPGQRLVTRIAVPGAFGGRWIYALAPHGTGTRATLTEEGFIDNVLFRFLAHHVFGHEGSLRAYAKDLEKRGLKAWDVRRARYTERGRRSEAWMPGSEDYTIVHT